MAGPFVSNDLYIVGASYVNLANLIGMLLRNPPIATVTFNASPTPGGVSAVSETGDSHVVRAAVCPIYALIPHSLIVPKASPSTETWVPPSAGPFAGVEKNIIGEFVDTTNGLPAMSWSK